MWGAGCIMAEMWTRTPIMQGSSEQQQIILISQLCGSITPEVWPGVESLDLYTKMELPMNHRRKVKDRLKYYVQNSYGCDLLDRLLLLDPSKRIDADTALNDDFFWTDPMPTDLGKLMSQLTKSMFELFAQPRRPGQMQRYYQQMNAANQSQSRQQDSYQDRVY